MTQGLRPDALQCGEANCLRRADVAVDQRTASPTGPFTWTTPLRQQQPESTAYRLPSRSTRAVRRTYGCAPAEPENISPCRHRLNARAICSRWLDQKPFHQASEMGSRTRVVCTTKHWMI